jgi:hypothetical protein
VRGYSDIECSRNYGLERTHLVLRRDASRGDLRRPGRMARIPSDVTYAAILLRCDHAQGLSVGIDRKPTRHVRSLRDFTGVPRSATVRAVNRLGTVSYSQQQEQRS